MQALHLAVGRTAAQGVTLQRWRYHCCCSCCWHSTACSWPAAGRSIPLPSASSRLAVRLRPTETVPHRWHLSFLSAARVGPAAAATPAAVALGQASAELVHCLVLSVHVRKCCLGQMHSSGDWGCLNMENFRWVEVTRSGPWGVQGCMHDGMA